MAYSNNCLPVMPYVHFFSGPLCLFCSTLPKAAGKAKPALHLCVLNLPKAV